MFRAIVVSTVILGHVATVASAEVPVYSTFKLQARSNIVDGFNLPPNSSFNSKTAALSDNGTIAFTLIAVGGGNAGLFVGSSGVGGVVYDAPAERTLEDPSINASGLVAFDQSDLFSDGIFVYDPVSGRTTRVLAPATFDLATRAEVTDDGAIGFRASSLGGAQSWRIFDAGVETIYAVEVGTLEFLFVPATNDAHEMAGKVRLDSLAGSAPDEIRRYDGVGSFLVMAEDADSNAQSPYSGFDNGVHLADDGRVAFIADTVGGDRGVFLTDGSTTTTIALESDPDVSEISFFRPVASEPGLVAFRGLDSAGLDAIFVGDGTELRRVIGEHDLIDTDLGIARIDQHDGSVTFGGGLAINAHGDIAFGAALTPADNDQIEWGSGMFVAIAGGNAAPPPVPDGDGVAGSPMLARRHENGLDIVVSWDAGTCPADDYNLFFGDLSQLPSLTLIAERCSLGASGTASVTPPAGDVFFLIASENAEGVESGHGVNGGGDPRPSNGIGICGIIDQSLDGVCR